MTDLSSAIQEFLHSRQARGIKPNTIRAERGVLRAFLTTTGNILVKNITGHHIDTYYARNPQLAPGTINRNRGYLQGFFAWCRSRKYMPQNHDPFEGFRKVPVPPRDYIFIPVDRFDELLDAAKNPRDRAALALGLYTLQRISTVTHFTWGDIHDTSPNPGDWSIQSYAPKVEVKDALPYCLELKEEMDRWRFEYGRIMGEPPRRDWRIVPAYQGGRYTNDKATGHLVRVGEPKLNPTAPLRKAEEVVQFALRQMGYTTIEREGAHTLRRSGGKALYEELAWNRGHDGAIRIVQSMMGHKSLQTTEHYLRLSLEKKRRNQLLSGANMFTTRTAEVVELAQKADHGA